MSDDLIDLHWKMGDLSFLLYEHQRKLVDHFEANHARKEVWHASRRLGKSASLLVIGMQTCIQNPKAIVRYGASTQKDVKEIIHPLMRILTESCPEELRPYWRQTEGKYFFPKKDSILVVSGLDEGRADSLRGTAMDVGVLDEAQNIGDLDYVIKSVLMPQLLTTNGRIIISGTSPQSSVHPFVPYIREAEQNNAYIKMTIYEDSRPEVLARIPEWCREAGGEQSTTWQREYMCEIVTDEESALVPEFSKPEIRAKVIKETERPPFLVPYTVVDLGYIDHTAVLFGYVDFRRGRRVILDELDLQRMNSQQIADAIRKKEAEVWGTLEGTKDLKQSPRRYADGELLTIADFNDIHRLSFTKVAEDTVEAKVNQLRLDIVSGTLEIHPRCVKTISQIQDGIWDNQHRKFARNSAYGHFDLVSALTYFVRHANLRENPYPEYYDFNPATHVIHQDRLRARDETANALKKAFQL